MQYCLPVTRNPQIIADYILQNFKFFPWVIIWSHILWPAIQIMDCGNHKIQCILTHFASAFWFPALIWVVHFCKIYDLDLFCCWVLDYVICSNLWNIHHFTCEFYNVWYFTVDFSHLSSPIFSGLQAFTGKSLTPRGRFFSIIFKTMIDFNHGCQFFTTIYL